MTPPVVAQTQPVQRQGLFVRKHGRYNQSPAAAAADVVQDRYAFQTRPGTYLEAGILSEAYLPLFHVKPTMTDRPGIPLIT